MNSLTFLMAGGGTGGHVIPAVAVAHELSKRGHRAVFVGTRRGFEARLVPAAGFPIEWIEIGGLMSVGFRRTLRTFAQLPAACLRAGRYLRQHRAAAVFSMGGYVAGPVMLAAWLRSVPMILMEPNAMPGLTNRRMGRFVRRALLGFEDTARWFPPGKTVLTGLPVRAGFYEVPPKPPGHTLTVLITGGSRGSRTLNNARGQLLPLVKSSGFPLKVMHQCGNEAYEGLKREFEVSGAPGSLSAFIDDMPRAFAQADLVVGRSGASAVAELAAAGKPSILVPFPYASEQHQLRNAQAMERAGAARVIPDREMTGERLFAELKELFDSPGLLERMGQAARGLSHPDAAVRAADILEEAASGNVA